MLDEDGNQKSLDQLLAMVKYAPIWSMINPSERNAVQYTAGVLRTDAPSIVKDAKRGSMVKKSETDGHDGRWTCHALRLFILPV